MDRITEKLGRQLMFFDGGMGSMLQARGVLNNTPPELINLTNPDVIIDIHRQYIQAGSTIITTNTLGAYRCHFDNLEEIISRAIINGRAAIAQESRKDIYIAYDMGPVGQLLAPLGELAFEDCYEIYKESAVLAEKYGADLVLLETQSDTYEAKAAILAVKENTNLPVICTMTFDSHGKTLTGGNIITMTAQLEGLGVDALGMNCGLGPQQIEKLFDELYQYTSLPILIQPNAGLPKVDENGRTCYNLDPDSFAESMARMCKKGAWILGGCCGTTPDHIRELTRMCRNITPPPVSEKNFTIVSSYGSYCILDKAPAIVGERINPTGKKKFKEALLSNDLSYIVNEALSQRDAGAHILDVNVGLPEIDEVQTMVDVIQAIQAVCDIPLQIDSSTPAVIEAALRIYNGKPLINSVSGKQSAMNALLPIAKKYGGVIIGLVVDEDGIPETAEQRVAIAEKIINSAEEHGIARKNIVIDPLTLTVSAQQKESAETLKAFHMLKERFNVKTLAGVSNISHGLPSRHFINAAYLTLTLSAGADLCIINPSLAEMSGAYHAYLVLAGIDKNCSGYISRYGQLDQPVKREQADPANTIDLRSCVVKGLKEQAYTETKTLLETLDPIDIINNQLIQGLDYVGAQYETGKMFLPQLIMSAESAKRSFDAINEHLAALGEKGEVKGRIILATVEGDSHDIGKNIAKALLENYGYEIIDLGKDVPAEKIVSTAVAGNIKLVGLSALMTTTVVNMERTIKELKLQLPDCKVMVGGAVLNKDYAKMIQADYYAKDALAGVNIAKQVFCK